VVSYRWYLPSEKILDADVRELFKETGLIFTVDDLLILLSGAHVRVTLPSDHLQRMCVYSASVHVPYVTAIEI
jgi:hypothetical protein